MQVAVGGFSHESHSFCNIPTTLDAFRRTALDEGEALFRRWGDGDSEIQGFLDAARHHRLTLVPTLMAWTWPAGPVTDEAYDYCVGRLCQHLSRLRPLDGVLLVLHGAMSTPTRVDPEADLLAAVRAVLPAGVPIVGVLDYHSNTTAAMVAAADCLIGYDTYPHVDLRERGREAADILVAIRQGHLRPASRLAKLRLAPIPQRQATGAYPAREILDLVHELEAQPRVVAITFAGGFVYADVPGLGASVTVTTDGDPALAQRLADTVAERAWALRQAFTVKLPSPAEAVAQALAEPRGPVVLVDIGDNIGGGTPGDGTVLLQELRRQGARNAVVILADPEAVAQAIAAGVRQSVCLRVGGKTDDLHGPPVEVTGTVRLIADGRFTNVGPMRDGLREDQGRTVVLEADGLCLVLTERKMPPWNLQQLRSLGIEPTRLHIMCVKAAVAHRAAWGPIAAREIEVDTPGLTTVDVTRFPYRRIPRPLFPFDPI